MGAISSMSDETFMYVVETSKSFADAVVALRKSAESAKWGILGDYNFSEILNSKGFPQSEEIKGIDICAPSHANTMMGIDKLTSLCMPCNVVVYRDGDVTKIAAMKPGAILPQLFPERARQFEESGKQVDQEIKAILDNAVSS